MARWLLALVVASLAVTALPARAPDADGDTLDDAVEGAVAMAHAPVLYFHPSERYFPTSVQYAFDNSVVEQYRANATPILADMTPTAAELGAPPYDTPTSPDQSYYLNNTQGTIRDDAGIQTAYQNGNYSRTVYVHVNTSGNQTVAQYWFFYPFNPGTWNNHEGDWEMITVVLQGSEPQWVGYSQHESGERMTWADADKDGTHPKVYVALGSHASYLKAYQGTFGVAGDKVSDAGPVWQPSDYALINVGEVTAPSAGNEWLRFAGRWGEFSLEYEARGEAGPEGPAYRQNQEMFSNPTSWAAGLTVPELHMLFLNWFIANLFTIFLALLLGFLVGKLVRLALLQHRTKAGRKLWPYAHLKPIDRKSLGMIVAVVGLIVGIVAFLLPWYVVSVDANAPGFLVTNGPVDLFRVDGISGVTLNPMRPDGSTVQVNVLPLPIGILLVITTAYFFLKVAGTKTARRLGMRFMLKGVVAMLPFLFVLLVAGLLLPSLGGGGGDSGSPGVSDFLGPVAASPFGGSNTIADSGGTATVTWGLGIGAWLLVVSALIMVVAGLLAMSQNYAFLPQMAADQTQQIPAGADIGVLAPMDPGQVDPGSTEPASMEPASMEPQAMDPASMEPASMEPQLLVPEGDSAGGQDVEPAASAPPEPDWQDPAPASSEPSQSDFCPVCGAPVQSGDTRCKVCDAQL